MTVEELQTLGIPLTQYREIDLLYVESALDWLKANTTLEFDKNELETVKNLPSGAKLFIVKFREMMDLPVGVTSESVNGLSQSFSDTLKKDALYELASELLGDYVKSSLSFVSAQPKWRNAPWL